MIFQCRLFGDDPVPETRCARPRRRPHHRRRRRGGRSSNNNHSNNNNISSSAFAANARAPAFARNQIPRRRSRRPHHRAARSRCTAQAARAGRAASRVGPFRAGGDGAAAQRGTGYRQNRRIERTALSAPVDLTRVESSRVREGRAPPSSVSRPTRDRTDPLAPRAALRLLTAVDGDNGWHP